jgi:hypothetical protein
MEGDKSEIHCPNCDERLYWWGYASSYMGDGSSELGLGCENPKCEGYEVMPQDLAEAIDIEEERIDG